MVPLADAVKSKQEEESPQGIKDMLHSGSIVEIEELEAEWSGQSAEVDYAMVGQELYGGGNETGSGDLSDLGFEQRVLLCTQPRSVAELTAAHFCSKVGAGREGFVRSRMWGRRGRGTGDGDGGQETGDGGRGTGDGGRRTGDGGRRTGDRRQGTGDGGRGTGRRGTGDGGRGTGDGGRGTGNGGRGTGDGGRGTGHGGRGTGHGARGTGDGARGTGAAQLLWPECEVV